MALLNFPNTRLNGDPLQNGDEYTGDNGVTYIYNNGKWVGHSPVLAAGTNALYNSGFVVQIDVNGNLVLEPGKSVRDTNGNILIAGTTGTNITSWDLTSQGNGCPINVTLTTTTFDVQVPRNHLFFRDDGSWDIGSYFNTNYITGDTSGGNGIALTTDRGTILFGNSPEQCTPTAASHFHIMRDDPANVDLFFGDDFDYVKLPSIPHGNGVEIGTGEGNYTWLFDSAGNLTFPGGTLLIQPTGGNPIGNIISSGDAPLLTFSAGTSTYAQMLWVDGVNGIPTNVSEIKADQHGVRIGTGAAQEDEFFVKASNFWQFDSTGTLTLPETNKITAYVPTSGYKLTGLTTPTEQVDITTYRWPTYDSTVQELIYGGLPFGEGWVFYPESDPAARVTVTYFSVNLVPPSYLQVTFSDTLGDGPYVVLSPDYVEERSSPITIGNNETNWIFGTDTTLTIPGDIQDANGSVIRVASTSTAPYRVNGQLWFNAEDGRAYIKYENNWVDLSPPLVPPVSTYLDGLTIDGTTISTVDSTATMYMGGDLLPEYNNMYDLGSAERQWKSLYVSTSTIYIGGTSLSVDANGTLLVDGMPIVAAANAGDRITSGTSSVILYGDGTVTLPGDIVVGDNNGHIYIDDDLGGASSIRWVNLNPSSAMLRVWSDGRNDLNNQRLELGYDIEGGLYITTTQNVDGIGNNLGDDFNWTFGADGALHFPDGSIQTTAYTGGNNVWIDTLKVKPEISYFNAGITSVQHDSQSNIVAVTNNFGIGYNTPALTKVDPSGNIIWAKYYSTSTNIDGWGTAVDSSDNIYVTGSKAGYVWLEKLNGTDGTPLWGKSLDGFEGYVVDVGSDDCPVIVGADWKSNKDLFVTKFSSTGTLLWTHDLGNINYDDEGWGMAIGPDNEVIAVGYTAHNSSGSQAAIVAKYSVGGDLLWQREIKDDNWPSYTAYGADAVVDSVGNIFVLFSQNSSSNLYAILFKMTPDGETISWNVTLAADGVCVANWGASLDLDFAGNIYLNSGVSNYDPGSGTFTGRTFISSFNGSGDLRWQRELLKNSSTLSAGQFDIVSPGSSLGYFSGQTRSGSSISVKGDRVVIGGGSAVIDPNLLPGDPYLYNYALGYIFQTTTNGTLFSQGEWSLIPSSWLLGSTLLDNNVGTCTTDTTTVQVIGDVSVDYDSDLTNTIIQRLSQGGNITFEYSTVQEGTEGSPQIGVTSITGNHDQHTGVALTSETWAQLMWVPDTSVITVFDISEGPDVYNWAYAGPDGFQIRNATTGTSNEWNFGTDGILTMPSGNETTAGWIQWSHASDDLTNTAGIGFVDHYNIYTGLGLVAPTDTNAAKGIWFGTPTDPTNPFQPETSMVFRGDTLYLPKNGYIKSHDRDYSGYPVIGTTGTSITIQTADTTSTQHNWVFSSDGRLTLPNSATIVDQEQEFPITGWVPGKLILTPPNVGTSTQSLVIYPTAFDPDSTHLHLSSGNLDITDIFLGNDDKFVKVGADGNVCIGTNTATNIWQFGTDGSLTLPLESKLNSGGVGVANSAEFGTSVTVSTSTVVNSEIYMGSGYGEFRSIYNKVGEIESGLTYAGVEGFNYAQYGDVNFSGMVSQTPHIDSMYTISVSTTTGLISIGFTQDGGTSVSKDWITVLGTLNAYYTVNGIFADTTQTVISGGDGVLSSIVKLTDSVNITTIDSITTGTGTQTWTFGTDGVLTFPNATGFANSEIYTTNGGYQTVFETFSTDNRGLGQKLTLDYDDAAVKIQSWPGMEWKFGQYGDLILPKGGVLNETPDTVTLSGTQTDGSMNVTYTRGNNNNYYVPGSSNWSIIYNSGTYGLTYIPQSLVYMQSTDLITWTLGPTASLDIQTPSTGTLTIGSTKITSKDKTWSFGTDGTTILPGLMTLPVTTSTPAITTATGTVAVCDGTGWNGGGDGLQHLMIYINDSWTKVV